MANNSLILMYHRISDPDVDPWGLVVTPKHFQEQLEVLKDMVATTQIQKLTPSLNSGKFTKPFVVLTFDDGYADNLSSAKPLLERYEIPATIFVVTGFLGRKSEPWDDELAKMLLRPGRLPERLQMKINANDVEWSLGTIDYTPDAFEKFRKWKAWEEPPTERHRLYYEVWRQLRPLSDFERDSVLSVLRDHLVMTEENVRTTGGMLSVEEVAKLENELIEIGCHTITHPYLSNLTPANQWIEIAKSKWFLEELLGHEIKSFAYPYGGSEDYNADSIRLTKQACYTSACSTVQGTVGLLTDPFQLPRMQVQDWNGDEFAKQLSEWLNGNTPPLCQS